MIKQEATNEATDGQLVDQRVGGFAEGAWVACDDPDQPRIARVLDSYVLDGELLLDLVMYRRDGTKVGRVSPACGGPRGFEPAMPATAWGLIEEPDWEWLAQPRYHWGDRVRWIKVPNTNNEGTPAPLDSPCL